MGTVVEGAGPPGRDDAPQECESQTSKFSDVPAGLFGDRNFGGVSEVGVNKSSYSNDSVVLILEFLPNKPMKFLIFLNRMGVVLGTALLGLEIWWRASEDTAALLFEKTAFIINTAVAAPLITMLFAVAVFYLHRIYKAWRSVLQWTARRKRYCLLGGINLIFEFLISVRHSKNIE